MSEQRERTFVMVKPDAVHRGFIGTILHRFEQKGFKMVALKMIWPSEELLHKHYSEHVDKPFFDKFMKYMCSGPVVPMIWEGLDVVRIGRQMMGATEPADSQLATIRGDYRIHIGRSVLHGSDSVESAAREINLWFTEDEIVNWNSANVEWVYE